MKPFRIGLAISLSSVDSWPFQSLKERFRFASDAEYYVRRGAKMKTMPNQQMSKIVFGYNWRSKTVAAAGSPTLLFRLFVYEKWNNLFWLIFLGAPKIVSAETRHRRSFFFLLLLHVVHDGETVFLRNLNNTIIPSFNFFCVERFFICIAGWQSFFDVCFFVVFRFFFCLN